MIHAQFIEDDKMGDLIDILWYCSAECYEEDLGVPADGHAYPGGTETDYDMFCANCSELIWHGLEVPY